MKRILYSFLVTLLPIQSIFAAAPVIECGDLPGCGGGAVSGKLAPISFIGSIIAEAIKYIAVIAVIMLMVAGIRYILAGGEEEKIAKAKSSIIWALVGVLLSISSWFIVNLINNLYIF